MSRFLRTPLLAQHSQFKCAWLARNASLTYAQRLAIVGGSALFSALETKRLILVGGSALRSVLEDFFASRFASLVPWRFSLAGCSERFPRAVSMSEVAILHIRHGNDRNARPRHGLDLRGQPGSLPAGKWEPQTPDPVTV